MKIEPGDRVVKIRNYGLYLLNARVDYEVVENGKKVAIQQKTKPLAIFQDYAFYIPESVNLNDGIGIVFTAEAVGGLRIMSIRLPYEPFCVYAYGYTLIPYAGVLACDKF